MLLDSTSWCSLATEVGNTLCHWYNSAQGDFMPWPPKGSGAIVSPRTLRIGDVV